MSVVVIRYVYSMNNQQMQLYAVNFIPLLGSLYMFRVFYTPIIRSTIFKLYLQPLGPPLWSSGQSFWLQIQRSRVRLPGATRFSE